MGVVWYRLRVDVRVRWRTLALIAVLVGDVPRVFRTADLWFNLRCDLLFHPFIVDLLRGPVLKS